MTEEFLSDEQHFWKGAQEIAAWLDVRYPGWYDRIDTDTLDMADCCNCVGGQLLGHKRGWEVLTAEAKADGELLHFYAEERGRYLIELIEQRRVRVPEVVPEEVPA